LTVWEKIASEAFHEVLSPQFSPNMRRHVLSKFLQAFKDAATKRTCIESERLNHKLEALERDASQYSHVAFQLSFPLTSFYPDNIKIHERRHGQDKTLCGLRFRPTVEVNGNQLSLISSEEKKNSKLIKCMVCGKLCGMQEIEDKILWVTKF
jgi:hypothetical protein